MIPDFSGDYVKYDNTADGDILIIVGEGKIEYNENLKKDMFNVPVELNGLKKTYSPNNDAGKAMQEAFGKDSNDWIGKKVQILHINKKLAIRPIKV